MRYIIDNDRLDKEEIMDMNESIAEEYLTWDEVSPKVFGYDHDIYRCFSVNGSGWNVENGLFHLEAKTFIWDLTLTIRADNFYIGWTWANGKFININKTFNWGDIITINMCKVVEFGERGKTTSQDVEITACYLVPFIPTWEEGLKEHAKNENELTGLKLTYLKSKVRKDNKRVYFQNGYPKFVVDDTLNMLFNNDKNLKNMKLMHERGVGGQDLEQMIWVYNYPNSCLWFENA